MIHVNRRSSLVEQCEKRNGFSPEPVEAVLCLLIPLSGEIMGYVCQQFGMGSKNGKGFLLAPEDIGCSLRSN